MNVDGEVECIGRKGRTGVSVTRRLVLVLLIVLPNTVSAQDSHCDAPGLDAAINRGLEFLAKDAMEWKAKHNCVSCHHAALPIWAMREAKLRGYAADEPVLADLTKWLAGSGDGRTGVPRPPGIPRALNTGAVWFALALGADSNRDEASRAGLKRFCGTVKSDQTENGSWLSWPETRPPIFGNSDDSITALATLSLGPTLGSRDVTDTLAIDKGLRRLAETKPDGELQSLAMRLVLWTRLGSPMKEWKPLIRLIKERQNRDGGWSQTKELASDAWATGQALYALANAGVKPDDRVIKRAHAFLVKTQREDGSWPMTSRPTKPGGTGATSLIPITGAGSSWAVLGLVRSK